MKRLWLFLVVSIAAASLTLSACGGGGGGGAPDADGDGLNANVDFNDNDATVLFETVAVQAQAGGPLSGTATGGTSFSSASAVSNANASGTFVVGVRDKADGTVQASLWSINTADALAPAVVQAVVDLNDGVPGGFSAAYDINDAGAIVGEATSAGSQFLPMLWTDKDAVGFSIGVGATDAGGAAYSINSAGLIVGEVAAADGSTSAAFWQVGAGNTITGPTLLPATGVTATSSSAYSIDDQGNVAGEVTVAGIAHAVHWKIIAGADPVFTDLFDSASESASVAFDANLDGTVAGEYTNLAGTKATSWILTGGVVVRGDNLGPDSTTSTVYALSESAATQMVGTVGTAAALWDSRTTNPLNFQNLTAATDAQAHDLNEEGVVVGTADNQVFVTLVR